MTRVVHLVFNLFGNAFGYITNPPVTCVSSETGRVELSFGFNFRNSTQPALPGFIL